MSETIARRRFLQGLTAVPAAALFESAALVQSASTHSRHPAATTQLSSPKVSLNVRDFGAKGDGSAVDTAAFQTALDRCAALGGGEVQVPAGDYLIGSVQLRSNTTLRLDAAATLRGTPNFDDYAVTTVRWEGKWIPGHIALIYAIDAQNVAVIGAGKIIGNPAVAGRPRPGSPRRHPALIEFIRSNGIHLEGFSTEYKSMWSVHPTSSENITIKNLTIRSTGGNGDGIDIDSCKHVTIDGCDISTGDDCISLKSGRGAEAYAMLETTEDVHISNCTFADSIFACIGIGSETSGGIRDVWIKECKFIGARTFAIYIKSRPGRGAFIENIFADGLEVSNCAGGFLRLNMANSGIQDQDPVPGIEGIPTARNWRFSNVVVHDVPKLVQAVELDPRKPLDGLWLTNISGTCKEGIFLANARHVVLKNMHVTGYSGALLNTYDVTGTGLAGAQPMPPPKPPAEIPTPATPYKLH
ncbi:MAG TPA: glycoside hydrolase family 28 protein [Candidatus Aquilonibacter sp.]|nr:glycoside hydrolase family 28 protein [Candidatus Aquilonibacter sp.]